MVLKGTTLEVTEAAVTEGRVEEVLRWLRSSLDRYGYDGEASVSSTFGLFGKWRHSFDGQKT